MIAPRNAIINSLFFEIRSRKESCRKTEMLGLQASFSETGFSDFFAPHNFDRLLGKKVKMKSKIFCFNIFPDFFNVCFMMFPTAFRRTKK